MKMPEKKEITIVSRGERTFAMPFSLEEIEAILLAYLSLNYNFAGWSIDLAWENDGSLTVNGHQDIKEG